MVLRTKGGHAGFLAQPGVRISGPEETGVEFSQGGNEAITNNPNPRLTKTIHRASIDMSTVSTRLKTAEGDEVG